MYLSGALNHLSGRIVTSVCFLQMSDSSLVGESIIYMKQPKASDVQSSATAVPRPSLSLYQNNL